MTHSEFVQGFLSFTESLLEYSYQIAVVYQHAYVFDEQPLYGTRTCQFPRATHPTDALKTSWTRNGPQNWRSDRVILEHWGGLVSGMFSLETEHNTPAITKHNANRT